MDQENRVMKLPVTLRMQIHVTRTQLEMTLWEFAKFMHIDAETLIAWEDGTAQPDSLSLALMETLQRRLALNRFQAPVIARMARSFGTISKLMEHLFTVWSAAV